MSLEIFESILVTKVST